tara:strand:- start:233 stop:628 length:396 start_codon:yes stop_codon:yes gene_type:complete
MKPKICIVMSTYNNDITNGMFNMAKVKLSNFGIKKIDLIKVPGAFEIPVAISKLIKKYDGFIAIGCIIKGETANFDLISRSITDGIMQLSIINKKPIGNAIITAFNKNQAETRLNKGTEAASAVLEVLKIK